MNKAWLLLLKSGAWFFGCLLLLISLGQLGSSVFGCLLNLIAGLILLPPIYKRLCQLGSKYKFVLKRYMTALTAFLLCIIGTSIFGGSANQKSSSNSTSQVSLNSLSNSQSKLVSSDDKSKIQVEAENKKQEEAAKSKEAADKAKKESDEKAKQEAEKIAEEQKENDLIDNAKPLPTWKILSRDAEEFEGSYYKFTGKIIQYTYTNGLTSLRIETPDAPVNNYSITDYVVLGTYYGKLDAFEGDTKTFIVKSKGKHTYETIAHYNITLPDFTIISSK